LTVQETSGEHLVYDRVWSHRFIARGGLASGFIAMLCCVSCASSEQQSLHKGNDLYDSGNYFEARLSYRAAIQHNPKLGEAYYKLGLTEEKLHDFRAALQVLNQAALLLPAREDVKASLGDLCLRGLNSDPSRPRNLHDTAVRISDDFLAKNPKSFTALRIKGSLALLDNRPGEAVGFFRRAWQQRTDDPDVTLRLFESLALSGNGAEAERTALQHIALRKADGSVYDALSTYYLGQNRVGDAERILKLKISNNPNEPSYVTELCKFYWRLGRQSEAIDLVGAMLVKPARPTAAHLSAGDFYASIGRLEEANRQFEEGMRSARDQEVLFQKRLLSLALDQGSNERAATLTNQILSERPDDDETLAVRARLRVESGQPMALAGAIEDYKIVLRRNSRDPNIHYGFGRALQRKGDTISAKVEFQEAISLEPGYSAAKTGLAEIAIDQQKPEEAIQWANKVLSVEPKNTQARILKASGLWGTGRSSEGRAELEQLIRDAPQDKSAYLQLGLIEIEEKNFPKAEAALEKLEDLGNEGPAASQVPFVRPGQLDRAYSFLKKELEHSPNHPLVHELLASISIQAGQYDRAINECRALLLLNANVPYAYIRLARVFRLKGDWNSYISSLQQAQRLSPTDVSLTVQLASALQRAGQSSDSIRLYRHAMELRPDDSQLLNSLASAILESDGNVDEAMRLAQRAVQKSPGEPWFLDTLGWACYKRNMTDRALQLLNGLVKQYPGNPTFRYHLGAVLLQKGDQPGAREALQLALANKPSKEHTERIRELLAQVR
jgi:tetratricopeptide (TPR) repeat protein